MKAEGERPKLDWNSSVPSHTDNPNKFAPAGSTSSLRLPLRSGSPVPDNRTTAHQQTEWSLLVGAKVEIRYKGRILRTGFVEHAMPDSSALWIAADTDSPRQIFEVCQGHQVWVTPQELFGELHYRMTVNQMLGASPRGVRTQLPQVEPTEPSIVVAKQH